MSRILLLIALSVLSACRAERFSVTVPEINRGRDVCKSESTPEEHKIASRAITPLTSLTASRPAELGGSTTGSLKASEWIDIIGWTGTGTATLNLVYYDVTAARWIKYGSDCTMTTASASCRYTAKVGTFYWHVYKSAGTITDVYIEAVVRTMGAIGSLEPVVASGLTNVTVSSPLSGDGTVGTPISLGTVGVANGGTGQTTITAGDLLVGSAGNNLSKLPIGASGRVLTSDGTTAAWTTRGVLTLGTGLTGTSFNGAADVTTAVSYGTTSGTATQGNDTRLLPAPSSAGREPWDNGTAWQALAAGSAGQIKQSGGAGAPSWVWLVDYRHLFTNAVAANNYFGQATTGAAQPRDSRAARVIVGGVVNFVSLTTLNTTGAGSVTVQIYTSTDGNTYSAVSGASRTITTSVTGSQTDSGAQSDFNVSAGDWLLAKITGYSGTTASLSVVIRTGSGARLAMRMRPANDNARADRMVA